VGPVWQGGGSREPELLASAYRSAMKLASEQGLRSIAFPAISTGIYGYPLEPATDVAVSTVRAMAGAGSSVEEVLFACFSAEVLQTYRQAGVVA
jgi:O-acetyl-ADP-ribose deacetylase (regulator of RNase III)